MLTTVLNAEIVCNGFSCKCSANMKGRSNGESNYFRSSIYEMSFFPDTRHLHNKLCGGVSMGPAGRWGSTLFGCGAQVRSGSILFKYANTSQTTCLLHTMHGPKHTWLRTTTLLYDRTVFPPELFQCHFHSDAHHQLGSHRPRLPVYLKRGISSGRVLRT